MAHVASNAVTSPSGTSIAVTIPAEASAGDVGVIQLGMSTSAIDPITLPAGWDVRISGEVGNLAYYVLTRLLTAGDPGSTVTVEYAVGNKTFGSITVVSGVSDVPELSVTPVTENTESTTRVAPGVSTSDTRQIIAGVISRGNNSPTDWTAPAGYAEETSAFGTGNGACCGSVGYAQVGAGGISEGTWTSDVSELRAVTWAFVLAPSATPLATPVVSVQVTNPSTPGGSDGEIDASWAAIANADHYLVELASGLNATSGFSTVADNVTATDYTISELEGGAYTVGVTAIPEG